MNRRKFLSSIFPAIATAPMALVAVGEDDCSVDSSWVEAECQNEGMSQEFYGIYIPRCGQRFKVPLGSMATPYCPKCHSSQDVSRWSESSKQKLYAVPIP